MTDWKVQMTTQKSENPLYLTSPDTDHSIRCSSEKVTTAIEVENEMVRNELWLGV